MKYFSLIIGLLILQSCNESQEYIPVESHKSSYLDYSERDDLISGGVKMIPIETTAGTFNVWTKRIGNNPNMKVLLLSGGPGISHEYFEAFDSYFPNAEIEYYYYDQLESAYSDKTGDKSLWTIDRYVDEIEQVRLAFDLDNSNFYLFGHSWGGIIGIEYALKYQENLKGLIVSNMVSSITDYNKYAREVLGPQLPPEVLAEVKELESNNEFDNPRYAELLFEHFYTSHILRKPLEEWPEPVNRAFAGINSDLYIHIQGPSEFGITEDATLITWDRSNDLSKLSVPTLTIGATHDTMDPEHMKWMASEAQNGRYHHCPNGSHMALYDDQKIYFDGLIKFIKDVNEGDFK